MKMGSKKPLAVVIFAILYLASIVISLASDLSDLETFAAYMEIQVPEIIWNQMYAAVLLFLRFSLALILLVFIWFKASNFAKWVLVFLALGRLINILELVERLNDGKQISIAWLLSLVLVLISIPFLFAPASRRWFRSKGQVHAAIFE